MHAYILYPHDLFYFLFYLVISNFTIHQGTYVPISTKSALRADAYIL
jgi:hypothetical protein